MSEPTHQHIDSVGTYAAIFAILIVLTFVTTGVAYIDLGAFSVVVALGRIAFDVYLSMLRDRGVIQTRAAFRFAHNQEHRTQPGPPLLISSYHPSQQNTSTGRLTEDMLRQVFLRVRARLAE